MFWPQGYGDNAYLQSLGLTADDLEILSPNLAAFDAALGSGDIDYVGTRLHGGIRAMQPLSRRSLIIAIDNRAKEMNRDFQIPIAGRGDSAGIANWIHGDAPTRIVLPDSEITLWKSQYE